MSSSPADLEFRRSLLAHARERLSAIEREVRELQTSVYEAECDVYKTLGQEAAARHFVSINEWRRISFLTMHLLGSYGIRPGQDLYSGASQVAERLVALGDVLKNMYDKNPDCSSDIITELERYDRTDWQRRIKENDWK